MCAIQKRTTGHALQVYIDGKGTQLTLSDTRKYWGIKDLRLLRMLYYVHTNFEVRALVSFHDIEGIKNKEADLLSRWKKKTQEEALMLELRDESAIKIEDASAKRLALEKAYESHFGMNKTYIHLEQKYD